MGKFKKGAMLGGLVGAALTWLNTSKKGKEVRSDIVAHAAKAYKELKEDLMESDKWKELTENEYVTKVTEFVDDYATKHDLNAKTKLLIKKLVEGQWKRINAEEKKK